MDLIRMISFIREVVLVVKLVQLFYLVIMKRIKKGIENEKVKIKEVKTKEVK